MSLDGSLKLLLPQRSPSKKWPLLCSPSGSKQWFGRLGVALLGTEGSVWSFYDGSSRRRRFEPSNSLAFFFSQAKCSSRLTQLSCWHDMMMPPRLPPHSFVFAEIFERIGPRERLVLWDPFGAVQCELGITSAAAAWPLACLSLSLPVSPVATVCCCFCFWTLHWIKATTAAAASRRQALRQGRKGPGTVADVDRRSLY